MTELHKITSGEKVRSSITNDNNSFTLRNIGQNTIQTLQDRAITQPADGGIFAEAYVDADGRQNSVDTGETESLFDTDKYGATKNSNITSTETTYSGGADTWTDTINAFDGDKTTFARGVKSNFIAFPNMWLGKTFSATNINMISYKCAGVYNPDGTPTANYQIYLQTYDGSTWSNVKTIYSKSGSPLSYDTFSAEGVYDNAGASIQGIRIWYTGTQGSDFSPGNIQLDVYKLEGGEPEETLITHTIPTGAFSSTLSTSFATFKAEDWESGADVQYKLTNTGGDDSGYLNMNEVAEFTAFTAEPDTMIVKLIPKTSSPTAGYPSINGVALYEID